MTTPTAITDRLLTAEPELGRSRLLCIDGPAGSGKTTLAGGVHDALRGIGLGVVVLHMDDLYRDWTGLDDELGERVRAQVIRPLASGREARWQQYDWHAGRFDQWHTFAPPDVLVLEGCGSGARDYAPYRSLLVWVEAPERQRIARGLARDGEGVRDHWMAWMRLEQAHFAAHGTRAAADEVVDTTTQETKGT